jgi:hypothetical protein
VRERGRSCDAAAEEALIVEEEEVLLERLVENIERHVQPRHAAGVANDLHWGATTRRPL